MTLAPTNMLSLITTQKDCKSSYFYVQRAAAHICPEICGLFCFLPQFKSEALLLLGSGEQEPTEFLIS